MIDENVIEYKKEKKETPTYCFAFLRFKVAPLLIISPISMVLCLYFVIVSILEKKYEPILLAISSGTIFIFLLLILLVLTIRFFKATNKMFYESNSVALELVINSERFTITNKLSKSKISFNLIEIKKIRVYKKVIVMEIMHKGLITLPNIPIIKNSLTR